MSNKPFGVEELNIVGSAGTSLIEAVADLHIRVGGGRTVGIGTSVFNIQDGTADANNDSVLNVGIVTANEYYGLFKGTIDPGTSTISVASSLTDVIGVNANQIYPKIASEDSILFWDLSETKTTYLKIGDGVEIDGDTLKGTYTLGGVDAAPNFTLRLNDGTTDDDVTFTAGTNISFGSTSETGVTINAVAGAGMDTDATTADVLTITGAILSADDPTADRIIFWDETAGKLTHLTAGSGLTITDTTITADTQAGTTYTLPTFGTTNASSGIRLSGGGVDDDVNITGSGGITVVGNVDNNTLTIDGTAVGKTYDLSVEQTGGTDADPVLRLTDGATNDDITITGSGSVTVTRNSATQLTIDGASSGGNDYTIPVYGTGNGTSGIRLLKNGSDHDSVSIFGMNGLKVVGNATDGFNGTALIIKTVSGEDVGGKTYTFSSVADVTNVNLRLNDGTTDQDVLLTAGSGITLDTVSATGFTISANATAGKTYDLSVEQASVGVNNNPILRLSDGTTNDDITIMGSGGISVTRDSGTQFMISGSAAGGLLLDSTVTDVLTLTGSTLSADDATADKIVFWDDDPGKLTYLTVGNGLAISGTEITATGDASFSVPGSDKQVLFNDGTFLAAASTLEYDKAGTGTLIKYDNYVRCVKTGGENHVDITADGGVEIKRTDSAVNTSSGPYIDFKTTGSDADARIQMERTAGDNFSSIKFYTNGFTSERLRIGKAGEIGIAGANYGTAGQVLTSGGDGASVVWGAGGGGTATTIAVSDEALTLWMDIVFSSGASSTEILRVNDTSGLANSLQVRASDGAVRVKGDITAFRGSDRRLKDNISPIKNALAKVSSISGNTFTWNEKSTDDKQGNNDTGVIAQEITALGLPGVTTTREDGTQAVMYEKLVPLLIEAIKELKEEVDELKSRS